MSSWFSKKEKPVAVVFGATGAQGGTVVSSLLDSGKFAVRGGTRNPESPDAKELAAKGVHMVKLDQENSEDIQNAFKGAYAAFVVTSPSWVPGHKPDEFEVGCNIAKLAKEAGIQHYVWSTLPNCEKISNGKYNIPFFMNKTKVDDFVKSQGFKYTTFVQANWYFSNLNRFREVYEKADGTVRFNLPFGPDTVHSGFDVDDMGPAVRSALEKPDEYNGKYISFEAIKAPMKEWLDTFTKVTGKKAELAGSDFNGPPPLRQMYSYFSEFGVFPGFDTTIAQKAVAGGLTTWEKWLQSKRDFVKTA